MVHSLSLQHRKSEGRLDPGLKAALNPVHNYPYPTVLEIEKAIAIRGVTLHTSYPQIHGVAKLSSAPINDIQPARADR